MPVGSQGETGEQGPGWQVEHRYRAVMEVLAGSPASEVAVRYGVSRQSICTWRDRYKEAGIDGLRDASRRPRTSPSRLPAEVEALVCELRRAHPRWGARRIAWEVAQKGAERAPSRATVHRVLERNGLVVPQEQRHKRKYKRWQRETPMALWQLDLVGGVYLADGRECKILSGIDDHSRFIVSAAVLAIPSGRAVADAFTTAMKRYGVPSEVLTDNGKQFTGRFTKPRPAEVLFERVCREHGITAKLTGPYSPTTTGKVERWHGTLRRELLDGCGPFADLPSAQAAIDGWVHAYNHARPSLGCARVSCDVASDGPGRASATRLCGCGARRRCRSNPSRLVSPPLRATPVVQLPQLWKSLTCAFHQDVQLILVSTPRESSAPVARHGHARQPVPPRRLPGSRASHRGSPAAGGACRCDGRAGPAAGPVAAGRRGRVRDRDLARRAAARLAQGPAGPDGQGTGRAGRPRLG
jgi:transposase InsO family protein